MCGLLKTLQHSTGVTVLHVTHDRSQVLTLADQLYHFEDGRIHVETDPQSLHQ